MRIFQKTKLAVGSIIELDAQASHHVGRVLRSKVGESLIVFNGEGGEYEAVIQSITKKTVTVELLKFINRDTKSNVHIHLGQALAKGEKMDWIIQKAVELGVAETTPLHTERSNVKLPADRLAKKLAHWQQVAISACEQSGRTDVPVIHSPIALNDWLSQTKFNHGFVLSPTANTKLSGSVEGRIGLIIGPEGGLTTQEIILAESKLFKAIQLGPRVLRTETAAIAAIVAVQYCFGDL